MAFERPDEELELDPILEKHFAGQLDGQLGRAGLAFEQHCRQSVRRMRIVRWSAAVSGLAAAAVIALTLVPHDGSVPAPQPTVVPVANGPDEGPGALQQVVWSRTMDQGTVFIDGQTPARKIVREQVREVRWTDPTGTRHIEASKPQRDVLLISLDTY